MASTSPTPDLPDLPPEQIEFTAQKAELEADCVGAILHLLGLAKRSGPPADLPIEFLANLRVYWRLFSWETAGITLHQKAGLPTSQDALRILFRHFKTGRETCSTLHNGLYDAVFGLLVNNFAWTGQQDLQATIQLDFPDEDRLVEAMARFLWSQRHTLSTPQGLTP